MALILPKTITQGNATPEYEISSSLGHPADAKFFDALKKEVIPVRDEYDEYIDAQFYAVRRRMAEYGKQEKDALYALCPILRNNRGLISRFMAVICDRPTLGNYAFDFSSMSPDLSGARSTVFPFSRPTSVASHRISRVLKFGRDSSGTLIAAIDLNLSPDDFEWLFKSDFMYNDLFSGTEDLRWSIYFMQKMLDYINLTGESIPITFTCDISVSEKGFGIGRNFYEIDKKYYSVIRSYIDFPGTKHRFYEATELASYKVVNYSVTGGESLMRILQSPVGIENKMLKSLIFKKVDSQSAVAIFNPQTSPAVGITYAQGVKDLKESDYGFTEQDMSIMRMVGKEDEILFDKPFDLRETGFPIL